MEAVLNEVTLVRENRSFRGSGGRSQENRQYHFRPAFMDSETRVAYASRFADGRLAPFHILDGLPDEVVVARHPSGRVSAAKPGMISGFLLDGKFFTREEAATMVEQARAA